MRRHYHKFRTKSQCVCDRHPCLDTGCSGFITRCRDDPPDLLSAVDDIDKKGAKTFLFVTVKYRCDKCPAIFIHQSDIGTFFVENLQIAPSPYRHRNIIETRIETSFCRDKEAVDINMQKHLKVLTTRVC